MQNWKVRKKLYQESWDLKDMKYRIQLLRELAMNSKQLKNAYEPLTKREKEN